MSTTIEEFQPGRYLVTFTRIGRTQSPKPLTADVCDPDDLADKIDKYARPFLGSREADVRVFTTGDGAIFVGGFRDAGIFSWERTGS